ncbi:hypothetical protein CNMCM5793_002372 [Aspergillus hiratsukae]|uniref:Major facilitator superfamily (MFS) profile domain-containing protein n=1 Tax=Aspergillus hiratsukae TaxID=1194566 RepID=A0A8H6PCJ3_9EURO|nr:hypothetical protein CNMCM5793_002372 [Aspergillus hiratsukae]
MTTDKPEIPEREEIEALSTAQAELESAKANSTVEKGADDALNFILNARGGDWREEEEHSIIRKIDFVVVPLLFLANIIGYADTQAYGFAALFGLVEDLKLYTVEIVNGQQAMNMEKYQWTAAIIALGSAAGQYPLLYTAQFLPYALFFGVILLFIGVMSTLVITCQNFSHIMALRFFLGFATVVQPLGVIMTSMWWKTDEQPLRLGIFISGTAFGNLVGQGIDLGAIKMRGSFAASPWKRIYIILGPCTIFIGVLFCAILPSTPMKAWFLTPREREIAVRRLAANQTGIQTRKFKWAQAREAFLDPQLYLLMVFSFTFAFSNNAVSSFGGFLVQSFGYSNERALMLFMPASAVALVAFLLAGFLSRRFPQHRIFTAICFIIPTLVGNILLWMSPRNNKAALLAGLYISSTFYGALVQHYSLIAANVAGHSKKTVINGAVTIMANLGSFSGPWAYRGSQASIGFRDGQIATVTLMGASIVSYSILWLYYTRCNKKKAALRERRSRDDPNLAFMDLTDQENPVFYYTR